MGNSSQDGRLSDVLQDKIASLDPVKPWVWQLKLSESEFVELEQALQVGVSHVEETIWARALLVYIAEWYKRSYQSGSSCPLLNEHREIDLEQVWKESNFAWKRLVYLDDTSKRRWLYSAYVLGGLAIKHELGRNDNLRFLKALCRIYHHEDYTLENLEDPSRAVSFRQSVKRHSLHDYMQEILNGRLPFNAEDLNDPSSETNRFVVAMRTANDEVMRNKFRLEWIFTNALGYPTMNRALRLWLRPEEVRGGLHQYLRYDRMVLWSIKHPESYQSFKVGIRFAQGDTVVNDIDWSHAAITFHNTGDEETGFIAVGPEQSALCDDVPVQPFDNIIIMGRTDDGKEYELQREKAGDCLQLWRISGTPDKWSSFQSAQRDTVVVFSPEWQIHLVSTSEALIHKPLSSQGKRGETWGWYYIYGQVTLSRNGEEFTFYNRQGYDRIVTRLYLDTIRYKNGGYVEYGYEYDEIEELPLIFGKEDIIVRHFATKDDITNAQPIKDTEIELIEFKQGVFYTPWTDNEQPQFGKITLRLTIKGKQQLFMACYLPKLNEDHPIERNFEHCTINYMGIDDDGHPKEKVHQDQIVKDYKHLEPTITLHIGKAKVEVYRPTLIKEIYLDEKILKYLDDGEDLNLPYIFKDRVNIADFSRQGYRLYQCSRLTSLFDNRFIHIEDNPNSGVAALAAWSRNDTFKARELDPFAPAFLFVSFGNRKEDSTTESEQFLFLDYGNASHPISIDFSDEKYRNRWGIIFQTLENAKCLSCHYPILNDDNYDDWDSWDENTSNESPAIDSFLQAMIHKVYFFMFKPLRKLEKNEYMNQILEPLIQLRDGTLTDEDIAALHRFAEEFNVDFNNTFKI